MANDVKEIGEIVWVDLTIPNAEKVREFHLSVIGWEANEFKMGDYSDYVITTPHSKRTVVFVTPGATMPPYRRIGSSTSRYEALRQA